jgi:PAS domain S-box-containing protein
VSENDARQPQQPMPHDDGAWEAAARGRESEERYRKLVDLSPDGSAVHQQGRFVYVNAAGARMLGATSAAELLGEPVLRFVHPEWVGRVTGRVRQLSEGEAVPPTVERLMRLDGEPVDVEITAVPITFDGAPAAQVIARDITERRRLEEAHEQRLRLDGALLVARTVAHELNNALSPVMGYAELLADRPAVEGDAVAREYARAIVASAAQAAETVLRLQRISRLEEMDSPLGPDKPILDLERSIAPVA